MELNIFCGNRERWLLCPALYVCPLFCLSPPAGSLTRSYPMFGWVAVTAKSSRQSLYKDVCRSSVVAVSLQQSPHSSLLTAVSLQQSPHSSLLTAVSSRLQLDNLHHVLGGWQAAAAAPDLLGKLFCGSHSISFQLLVKCWDWNKVLQTSCKSCLLPTYKEVQKCFF